MTLLEAAHAASQRLLSAPRDAAIHLLARQSADGLAAAAILARALLRAGIDFHARFIADHVGPVEPELDDEATCRLLLGLAPDLTERVAGLPGTTIVVSHAAVPDPAREDCLALNPASYGDARGASTSSTAFALAVSLNESNWDLAPLALAGAQAEGQLRPTPQGWNQTIHEQGKRRGAILDPVGLALDDEPLLDALAYPPAWMTGLWSPGYAGARAFLNEHGLPEEATMDELSGADRQRLAGSLALAHLRLGRPAAEASRLFAPCLRAAPPGLALGRIAALLEAAAAEGEPGISLAWLLGDDTARADLEGLCARYRKRFRGEIEKIEAAQPLDGPLARLVRTDDARIVDSMAQFLCNRVPAGGRPTLVYAVADGRVRAALRGPSAPGDHSEPEQVLRIFGDSDAFTIARGPGVSIVGPADRFHELVDRLVRPLPAPPETAR